MGIETFASPGLRWGLLLDDHPRAIHEFDLKKGTDIGVPSAYGGDGMFCVCTISIPGQEPIAAYKEAPKKNDPDEWVVACTKTLGRALKKAGYPDDLKDLKALVLWRQRDAEIAAIRGGVAIESTPAPLEIEAGGRDADDDGKPDVGHGVTDRADIAQPPADSLGYESNADSNVVDAEIVEDAPADGNATGDDPPRSAKWESLVEEVEALGPNDRKELVQFLKNNSISDDPNDWADDDVAEIDAWFGEPG